MTEMIDRIGIDFGVRMPIEDALAWAAEHGVSHIDVRLGDTGNEFSTFDSKRIGGVRETIERTGIHVGLHTLSAVNMAETAPYLSEAVEEYLRSYIDIASPLGAEWIVVHAGFHFTGDYERRRLKGLERLTWLGDYAHPKGVPLLLENMNPEPRDAEVRYLAHDVEECRYYFDNLDPERVRWSYTVNHAHLLPEGVGDFFDQFDASRMSEVRVADNRADKEEHLRIGEGTIDFEDMFRRIEGSGYRGHYMLAFATVDEMLEDRKKLTEIYENTKK